MAGRQKSLSREFLAVSQGSVVSPRKRGRPAAELAPAGTHKRLLLLLTPPNYFQPSPSVKLMKRMKNSIWMWRRCTWLWMTWRTTTAMKKRWIRTLGLRAARRTRSRCDASSFPSCLPPANASFFFFSLFFSSSSCCRSLTPRSTASGRAAYCSTFCGQSSIGADTSASCARRRRRGSTRRT